MQPAELASSKRVAGSCEASVEAPGEADLHAGATTGETARYLGSLPRISGHGLLAEYREAGLERQIKKDGMSIGGCGNDNAVDVRRPHVGRVVKGLSADRGSDFSARPGSESATRTCQQPARTPASGRGASLRGQAR